MKLGAAYYTMFHMVKLGRPARLVVQTQEKRSAFVGVRLRRSDADKLARIAEREGLRGVSQVARMILEAYVASHSPTTKSSRSKR